MENQNQNKIQAMWIDAAITIGALVIIFAFIDPVADYKDLKVIADGFSDISSDGFTTKQLAAVIIATGGAILSALYSILAALVAILLIKGLNSKTL